MKNELDRFGHIPTLAGNSGNSSELLHGLAVFLYQALGQYLARQPGSAKLVAAQSSPRIQEKKIGQVVDELIAAKKADGFSLRYVQTLRSNLGQFAEAFDRNMDVITSAEMETWLRTKKIGPRARNNIRASIIALFRFARKQGYLPKGQGTEADEIARAKDIGGAIGILRPDQLRQILSKGGERVRLFVALGSFTGMRSAEILRLDWSEVNFERKFITVAAEKAKTATRRLVPIQPNLSHWLARYRGKTGRVFRSRRDAARAIAFAKSKGIDWPNNALRHSYATYRLALIADAGRVALEMGNSPQKLIRHYRELADEKEAKAWFSIRP